MKQRVGVVGYGHLGKYLVNQILKDDRLELAFVWNRSKEALDDFQHKDLVLENLCDFLTRDADLIVEVAHPKITQQWGPQFLQHADYMIGSPTALSDQKLESALRKAATIHSLYIPSGAFWGGEDIKKMADRGSLQALKVTMTKHPTSFKLEADLKTKCENSLTLNEAAVLYDGPVRDLCPLAPNNVNTMAAAALAAHNLGFDKVQGSIIADPRLTDWHIVEVETWGPGSIEDNTAFHVKTVRQNPAQLGAVTGNATYASFFSSILGAHGKGPGVHLC